MIVPIFSSSLMQELMGQQGFVPCILKLCQSSSEPASLAGTRLLALLAQSALNCPSIVSYGSFSW